MIKIYVKIENDKLILTSDKKFLPVVYKEFDVDSDSKMEAIDDKFVYTIPDLSYNRFIIKCISDKLHNVVFDNEEEFMLDISDELYPTAELKDSSTILIKAPYIYSYTKLLAHLGASNRMLTYWTIPFNKLYEVYRYLKVWKHPFLPAFKIEDSLKKELSKPLSSKKPSIEELFNIELTELATIKSAEEDLPPKWALKPKGFKKLKYKSAVDLLLAKPKSYQDRTSLTTFSYAPFGEHSYVKCVINEISNNFGNLKLVVTDAYNTTIETMIYASGYKARTFEVGEVVLLEVMRTGGRRFNTFNIISIEETRALPIVPNYRQSPSNNILNPLLVNATQELLLRYDGSELFNYVKGTKKPFWEDLENLHFPENAEGFEETLEDLAYYELFCLQLLFYDDKINKGKPIGVSKDEDKLNLMEDYIQTLPYELTNGQKHAISEIVKRLKTNTAEKVLLSGDVGVGKSNVANAACFYTVGAGFQATLVGPTEILAKQLYNGIIQQLDKMKIKPVVAYLSGNTRAKEKRELQELIKKGEIDIIVGTHSVLDLEYKNLGLLVVDEQQKFGRAQREKLNMSRADGKTIDILEQTATPIPQSTARAFYGDIDLITLTEKPKGRKENITKWIKMSSDEFLTTIYNDVWSHIEKEIKANHQIFIVAPAVDEKAKSASVKKTAKILTQKNPNIKINYIYGSMPKDKQNKILQDFRDNKFSVLIASSIVEVGIDIPNSTIMLVLDANRFGASSLHQIRGRVGRSDLQGYCYLIAKESTPEATRRLKSLEDSNNGFDIALVDLETRDSGNLFTEQQSGESNLKFCNLTSYSHLIEKACNEAKRIYNSDKRDIAIQDAKAFLRKEDED